jgi:hypothetical protein
MISQKRYTRNGKFRIVQKWSQTPSYWVTDRGQIPYDWSTVVLEEVNTGRRRECDNLAEHGFYSLLLRGRQSYIDRFLPIEKMHDAIYLATHYYQGKFGFLAPRQEKPRR